MGILRIMGPFFGHHLQGSTNSPRSRPPKARQTNKLLPRNLRFEDSHCRPGRFFGRHLRYFPMASESRRAASQARRPPTLHALRYSSERARLQSAEVYLTIAGHRRLKAAADRVILQFSTRNIAFIQKTA